MTIGILGGTFDPIHFGHLRPAVELLQDLALSEVRFVPSNVPPHRDATCATGQQRLRMVSAAIAGEPGLSVDDRELRRPGPSYMVETLRSLRQDLGQTPLCMIVGVDAFMGLPTWYCWRELITLAHIIVMRRPGKIASYSGELAQLMQTHQIDHPDKLHQRESGWILCTDVTQLEISATQIRALVAQGKSIRYLVPNAVAELIATEKIFAH